LEKKITSSQFPLTVRLNSLYLFVPISGRYGKYSNFSFVSQQSGGTGLVNIQDTETLTHVRDCLSTTGNCSNDAHGSYQSGTTDRPFAIPIIFSHHSDVRIEDPVQC
jgi:hypothetical protein